MPKLFPIFVKKVTTVAASSANFLGLENAGTKLNTILTSLASETPAAQLSLAPITMTTPETPAAQLTSLVSGTGQPTEQPATAVSAVVSGTTPETPAGKVVQIQWDLTGTYGANGNLVSHVVGSTDWANPQNAMGTPNGANATVAGQAASNVQALLKLFYPASVGKTDLTITAATLSITCACTQTGVSTFFRFGYSYDGTDPMTSGTAVRLIDETTSRASGTYTFDVFANVNTWTRVGALQTGIEFKAPVAGTANTASVDAVVLTITASTTQIQ